MSQLSTIIEQAFEDRANYSATDCPTEIRQAVEQALAGLDNGTLRVAEKIDGEWVVHQWLKKAVLLSFKLNDNQPIEACDLQFYDKVATKYSGWTEEQFKAAGVRVVPPAVARRGSFQAKNVVLMPSYVNIGAYVDEGTMVDTWATVGSCAQIGKNVHLSGGVGIGGVLEPLQANPTIIEDNCFIGARSEIVEGVIVGEGSEFQWAFSLVNRLRSMIVKLARSIMVEYQQVLWLLRAVCHLSVVPTAFMPRLS